MVLVRHRVDVSYTEQEQATIVEEFAGWARQLAEQGHLVQANELAMSGTEFRLVNGENESSDLNLTPASSTGYFLLRADDYEAASALVRTCPFLRRGGTLELRRVIEHGG
jgi:hypothetical protein